MLDESKNIRNRLKRAKDIHNVIHRLENEGYTCEYGNNKLDNGKLQEFYTIRKGNITTTIYYEQNNNTDSEYKQIIHYILY